MQDTVTERVAGLAGGQSQAAILPVLKELADRNNSVSLVNAALAINSAGDVRPLIGTAWYGLAGCVPVTLSASHPFTTAQMSGFNIATAMINVIGIGMDHNSTISFNMGTAGATLAATKFPATVEGVAPIGYMIITAAAGAAFTGGTTALDSTATGAACVYISPIGSFDANIQL